MNNDLLHYYNRELSYIRHLGHQFAQANPDVAPQLGLDRAAIAQDPYVERLIEAFAFINARTHKKLDDDFSEISDALLNVLYPHYQAPVPSMAIVQLELAADQGDLAAGYSIPRGAGIETEEVDGHPCFFQTCYALTLYPLRVGQARIDSLGVIPQVGAADRARSVLRIGIASFTPDAGLNKMPVDRLRFFISGPTAYANAVYELIFRHAVEVAICGEGKDCEPVVLGTSNIAPVGFEKDEGMLAYSRRSFHGYRLLSEYFAIPEKFLFFDLCGLSPSVLANLSQKAEIWIYLDKQDDNVARHVDAETFRLGCTPIVNLFRTLADPFRLTHEQSEYHLVPDERRRDALEVYSVQEVSVIDQAGRCEVVEPFYSIQHAIDRPGDRFYWYASRRDADPLDGKSDAGTEIDLMFVDLSFQPIEIADRTVRVETICLNRDLPGRLEFGGGRPRMQLSTGGPLAPIRCMTAPTPTRRPPLDAAATWRLISHLSLNHLSLTGGVEGADALKQILMLYEFMGTPERMAKIHGIARVEYKRSTAQIGPRGTAWFCRGNDVAVSFDTERFGDQGLFLFATVLERFLGLYCSINSFTRMTALTYPGNKVIYRWPPRAANRVLL